MEHHGIYILPLHRSFAYYFTRLIFFNYIDNKVLSDEKSKLPLSDVLRKIFEINLPLSKFFSQLKNLLQIKNGVANSKTSFVNVVKLLTVNLQSLNHAAYDRVNTQDTLDLGHRTYACVHM